MYLQLDTKFNPFTYDEMVKPLLYYKQAYDEAEAAYSDLATQTEAWKDIANREKSPEAFERYQRYSGDLSRAIDDFSQGMTAKNRRALLGLKRRYIQDIAPIAKASEKIEELSSEQRKLAASNPNIMFDRDFGSEVSIDQMIENPNLSYRAIDGNDLYTKGAAISKAMSSRLHSVNPTLKSQYWEIRKGFGEEAANKFLLDSGAIPELNKALEDLVDAVNAPDKLKNRVFEYAKQGAISGMIGDTSYQSNRGYESPADYNKRILSEKIAKQQIGEIPYREDPDGTKYYVNTSANTTWSVNKEGTVKVGGTPRGSGDKKPNLVPDPTLGGDYFYDTNNPSHKYKIDEEGNPIRQTTEMINSDNKNSLVRIQSYVKRNLVKSKPNEIVMFSIDGDGNISKKLTRENNLSDFEKLYNDKNSTVRPIADYLNGDLGSDNAKKIRTELASVGLELEDVEVVSSNDTGWFGDEHILIRTKQNTNSSSNRANASSKQ